MEECGIVWASNLCLKGGVMLNRKTKGLALLVLGMLFLSVAGCSGVSMMKGYAGPDLSPAQTATISAGSQTDIISCDGKKLGQFQSGVVVTPGTHTIDAALAWRDDGGNVAYSSSALGSVTFNAEAGHWYQVSASMDYSSDSWTAVIADTGSHAKVAVSQALHMDVLLRPRSDAAH